MRIEIIQLPEDKFRLEDLVDSELLLRLLRAKDIREFVQIVNRLKLEEQIQISQEITRLPGKLEERVTAMLLNAFDTALEHPVSDEKDIVQFIRALKRLLVACLDSSFESDDRLLVLAEFHPNIEVMSEAVEVLVSRVKSKAQLNVKLTNILRDIIRANEGMQTEGLTFKRFGSLSEEDQLRLNLFCKIHLYLLNPVKYPIREDQLRPYFIMLRTKPYLWLLNLLQSIKSEQMSFIYRDILDAKISLTPIFHFQTSDRYIHPELVNAEAMEIAVDREKTVFVTIAHSPDSIIECPGSIYFKFNMLIYRMYEQCIAVGDSGEIMPINEQIETQFTNMVGFLLQTVKAFICKKEFITMTTDGEKHKTEYEKLSLLDINLRALDEMIQRYNLSASSKIIAERDLLTLTLTLVESLLLRKCTSKFVWDIFRRTLSLYMILITVASSNLNLIAASQFPEVIIRIIDTYELPKHEPTLNQIFEFTASFLEPLLQKANRGVQGTSLNFTRRMLDAYFESECPPRTMDLGMFQENALEHYLRKEKSLNAKATFNQFMIEKLRILETPEHSVENLMANPKKRSKVVLQINKLLRVLDSTVIRLEPETSKLLTFRLMQYFILFEDQVRDENLSKIKRKLEFQHTKAIYQQALTMVINLLEKDPFSQMSLECLLRQFGNELHDDWTTMLQIFRNLHMVIFLNVFRQGDYSEASFHKTFKITKMLCKCKSQIQQRLSKQLKQEGVKRIDQLQLLASIKGLETTYGLLYSFFRRLKQGLAMLKVHNSALQQVISLDQKINMINGLKEMFPILTEDVSKHQLILYIDSFSDVLYGCGSDNQQVLSLHYILNLYTTFRESLFKTLNTLNGIVKDKTKIHNTVFLKLKTLDDYIGYFKKTPQKFDDDIETKFAQNINKLLRLFILRPVATQWPFRYRGVDFADSSANKMGLGMYLDQFDQIVKNLTMSNLELYSKCVRFFLQPNFYDNLLLNHNDRRLGRHNNRAAREAIEHLLRMGVHLEVARMAISQVDEPQPELALEWINNHRDDIETMERAHLNRSVHQSSRNRLSQQPTVGAIQEIEPQNLPQKMKGLLKQLIKDILRPNMYSEYSELIQNMFIEAIDRFEKDESRLSNYIQLSKLIIKDFLGSLIRIGDQLQSFNQNHIFIQLNLLKSIVSKCQNKKQVRMIYLSETPFFPQLLGLIDLITHTGEFSELREKIIEAGLTIICLLMPNKKKEGIDRSSQITAILSVLFRVTALLHNIENETRKRYIEDLIIQAINKAMEDKHRQTSTISTDILIRLISEDNIPTSISEIIESVLSQDSQFLEANIESEIKAYFFQRRSDNNLISVPKRSFLTALEKYNSNPRFYTVCKILIRKQYEKPAQGKKHTNIVYSQSLHTFFDSQILQKPFINCLPSDGVRKVVSSMLSSMFSRGNILPAHIKIIHQLLHKFPLLTPYVLNFQIGETVLLNKLIISAAENDMQMSTILFFLCLNCPVVVQCQRKEALLSSFIQSRIITKFYQMMDKKTPTKRDCRLMLLLANLLQLKEFNKMANFDLSKDRTDSLRSLLEKMLVRNCASKQLVYVAEPLSLILKYAIIESLKNKYKLYQEIRDGSIEQQMIPLQIIISEGNNERRDLMEELQRTGEELENDEENGQMLIAALERRLMNRYTEMFRRRVSDRSNIEFLPIEVEDNKPLEPKKPTNEGASQQIQVAEQKMIVEDGERKILPNHQLLDISFDYSGPLKHEDQPTSLPKDFSTFVEGDSQYEAKPNRPINYDNQKNQSLRNRLNVLALSLKERKPTETMQIEQQKLDVPQQPQLLEEEGNEGGRMGGRGLSIPLDMLLGRRDRSLAQLLPQRLGLGRGVRGGHIELLQDELVSDRSDAQLGPRRIILRRFLGDPGERGRERELMHMETQPRATRQNLDFRNERERPPLQENEIQRILEEEVEPPKPIVEKKPAEEIKPSERSSMVVPISQSQPASIVASIVHQHIVAPLPGNQPELVPADQQPTQQIQIVPKQAERMQVEHHVLPSLQAVEPNRAQIVEEEKSAQLERPLQGDRMQVQMFVQQPHQPLPVPIEYQNPHRLPSEPVESQNVQQPLLSNVPAAVENQIEPEVRHRPILQMLGLPQSFLRDNGLDEELFDSLPETIQMEEILLPMMGQGQQGRRERPPASRSEDHKEEQPGMEIDQEYLQGLPQDQRRMLLESMQPRNLVSENLALLSEIEDPALRESILIEATPEQLASFPQQIQAEAEMLRTRRLRQIAADFEEDDHMVEAQRSRSKRPKRPSVYPDIEASLFQPIPEEAAKACLNILYWSFPKNYKSLIIQSLLQNKLMQPKVITTLLYILRNPLQNGHFPSEISYFNEEKAIDKDIKSPASIVRGNILSILLDLFTSCPYKDNNIMKEKISYNGLNEIQLKPLVEFGQTSGGYQPYIELLDYALDYSTQLSAYLLDNVTDLPESTMRKLIKKLYSCSLDDSFISNLKGLSDNPQMAKVFEQEVTETHHPKISIYAHLLKYKFANTKYLHKLHLKALASYKPEYNEFLNQIYRIYTLQDLKDFKQLGHYKSIHRNVIKALLARKCKLSEQPIYLIMSFPFLMDFETKKEIFHNQIKALNEQRYMSKLEIKVNRKDIFRKSFNQIMARTGQELRARLCVVYDEEGAYDAGGLTRDWFLSISKEMFNRDYALFETSTSGNTYQPSSKSHVNPDHLKFFKFVGRVVGKALSERENIDAFFTRSFYKLILGQELELSDLQEQDYELHKSMQYYRTNPVTDEFNFTHISHKFGVDEVKQLIPGGKNILVNEQNKQEWIRKMAEAKMKDEIQPQIKAFLQGFHELIPADSIKFFDAKELELLISGLPNIDCKNIYNAVDDLRSNIEYSGYTHSDNIIRWFWEILETYDHQHLAQVIQFITGTSKIPAQGFKALKGMHGPQKISIVKSYEKNRLPQAHTCYNQLELPDYPTKAVLEKNMEILFKWGNEGFGFM